MMLKKIILLFSIFLLTFSMPHALVSAEECAHSGCISSSKFEINVGSITPTTTSDSGGVVGENAGKTIQNTLGLVIEKMILAFGILSLLVMTIGAGFMIVYHGQDELLTRGKSIFSYGLISLVVALSAGMLVQFVTYLLYGTF